MSFRILGGRERLKESAINRWVESIAAEGTPIETHMFSMQISRYIDQFSEFED